MIRWQRLTAHWRARLSVNNLNYGLFLAQKTVLRLQNSLNIEHTSFNQLLCPLMKLQSGFIVIAWKSTSSESLLEIIWKPRRFDTNVFTIFGRTISLNRAHCSFFVLLFNGIFSLYMLESLRSWWRASCANLFQVNLQEALKDNLKLAQEYQELQNALMIARQEAVYVFDRRNRAEAYIQDHKQVTLITTNTFLSLQLLPYVCLHQGYFLHVWMMWLSIFIIRDRQQACKIVMRERSARTSVRSRAPRCLS